MRKHAETVMGEIDDLASAIFSDGLYFNWWHEDLEGSYCGKNPYWRLDHTVDMAELFVELNKYSERMEAL